MSIIYNALQKTQRNRSGRRTRFYHTAGVLPSRIMSIVSIITISALFAMAIYTVYKYFPPLSSFHFAKTETPKVSKQLPTPPPIQHINQAVYKSKHFLNGVYVSDQEKFAMINFQMFHVGDMVDGLRVTSITTNSVTLQNNYDTVMMQILS